ncbi:MAG: outer membrane protein assembly factor BamA [Spirochaetaceae bacterium]|jgi:outer membrane protein insertion porin family|nr:outer membrane protein assembly factor BamA [Spirochaetaceae bacterium]
MVLKKCATPRLLLPAFLFLLTLGNLCAQSSEDWYWGKTLRKVEFQGLNNVKMSDLEGITRPFTGKPFTEEVYSDILARLYALDFFEDISPMIIQADQERTTVNLRFTVVERPIVYDIAFSGNRQVRRTELQETVSLKEKDVFVESKLLLDERALRDLYLKKGFTDVTVSSKTSEGPKGINVTFVISEGISTRVTTISFQGNTVFPEKTLKRQLETKEGTFIKKSYFQEAQLEQDRQTLLTYYQNQGYIDALILDMQQTVIHNEKGKQNEMAILFVLQEGDRYTYGGITFSGNEIFATDRLMKLVDLKPGAVFNQTKFQSGIMAVADLYYENGYTANSFNPEPIKNSETREISYNFTIVERPRSHIENIIIRGNEKTRDTVILRELPIESGDIFSKAKITTGMRNLYNLQFFSAVMPDVVPGSEDNLVDLVFNVEEQSTMSIEFGLTFSGVTDPDDFPLSLFMRLQDINIRGTGKTGSINTTLSPQQQSLVLGYGDSWIFGRPMSLSISADVTHSSLTTLQNMYLPEGPNRDYYMNYDQLSFSLSAGLGRRWFPEIGIFTVSGGIGTSLIQNYYDAKFEPYDETIADYHGSFTPRNNVWTAVSLDDRDINHDPSKGWFTSQRFTWTGLLREVEKEFFLRTDTKGEIYFTLLNLPVTSKWNLKFVLAGLASMSFLVPAPTVGENSRLYIDGMFNGRGWSELYNRNRGESQLYGTLEMRSPLVPGFIALDFFFDAIANKPKANDLFTDLGKNDFYFSYGPGIRFTLPQFPLRFLWAWKFHYVDNEIVWATRRNSPAFVLSFNIVNK